MLARVTTGAIYGLEGIKVTVEVDVSLRGFPGFTIVGLPNKAVDEAKERVRTAIANTGFSMPDARITVNLAPANIPKSGSGYDLAIALGILAASGEVRQESLENKLFIGELSLRGEIRKVSGIIPVIILAQQEKIDELYIPQDNESDTILFSGATIYPVKHLQDVIAYINHDKEPIPFIPPHSKKQITEDVAYDFADIKGQEQAKRALEIAATGFHNIHLKGPPGAGKTFLSRAFPSILPLLEEEELLEVSKIYSVIDSLHTTLFEGVRPFRSPHHTTSQVGLIGGGTNPRPGEISLAHRGVLFLDEFPEFPRNVLESIRQPMEDGVVTVSRASGSVTFPARFLLVAASNPCPCGYFGHPNKQCTCLPGNIARYQKKLSGPLLDRIDLHVDVAPVEVEKLSTFDAGETSVRVRERVLSGRKVQKKRFAKTSINFNGEMSSTMVQEFCHLTGEAQSLLNRATEKLSLSARSYFKTIKVSRTIADLAGDTRIEKRHIAEALQYRP
ncbi:YifB family Mg chelatase-like AAA ATPase [Candidatus Woesebacteria bacterium]|nr:YifB family Mg chelatase-like AAA ATPase [Candidatus Woesebacteria bacterium]